MAENNIGSDINKYCGCLGYAYVPIQELATTYDVSTALTEGTIFPELNLKIDEYGKVCHKQGGSV